MNLIRNNSSKQQRRLPAEWEYQDGVALTFPHPDSDWVEVLETVSPVFVEIIISIARFESVLVICDEIDRVKRYFDTIPNNVHFVKCPSNDTWARDHMALSIESDGKMLLLDFMFNGWGLKFPADRDNLITQNLFQAGLFATEVPPIATGIVLEGGGIESDGEGTLLTTSACMLSPNRNPHLSKEAIEDHLKYFFGVQRVLWLNHGFLAGDDTDSHIDTLARFCSQDTIAYVKCDDEEDIHYDALKAMESELTQMTQLDGTPYRLVPLPMATPVFDDEGQRLPATYANFLIINEAVLVPIYNDASKDKEALETISSCFPDRNIIGINCLPLILQHGSLHCVTMQFPKGTLNLNL